MINPTVFLENENGKIFIYPDEMLGWILGVHILKYSLSLHKYYKEVFKLVRQELKEMNISRVYGLCETEKEKKFNETFGLVFTGEIAMCADGKDRYIMKWEV